MVSRSVLVLLPLLVLMVRADLESKHAAGEPMSTGADVTSEESPTESMKSVSPDQPDESQHQDGQTAGTSSSSSELIDVHATNQVAALDAAVTTVTSAEDDDDEASDSEEEGRKKPIARSAKARSSAHIQQSSVRMAASPALQSQPIITQPKVAPRSRTSKRRSRTSRRQV